ncbi:hypothetical protein Sjap_009193 [Stephania japonica]|uniref:Uncharacterized protein n=1 Tax=Stephania japonica TaxID=461633 RepID=A0AAP0JRH8_9MAGN
MEEERGEWEIVEEEEGGGGGGDDGKMRLILNKGWGVGKKIIITGVVISSAPIVLPPLVVFSTLGFAFAVPFGVYFASYACMDKIMSKLLSSPPSEEDEEGEEQMVGVEGEVGYVEGEKAKPVADADIGEENEQNVEEAKVEETMEIEEVKKPIAESKDESKKGEEVPVQEVEKRKSEGGIGNAQEKEPSEKENGVVRIEKEEKKSMLDESENGEITSDHSNVDDKKAKTEEITSDSEPKQGSSSEVSSPATEGHSKVDDASDASNQGSTDPAVRGPAGSRTADKRTRKSKTGAAVSSKEVYIEEKKIWEQIDALRKILGYKIAPQVNSMEEVKALYVFTGVEPPSAFKGPSDIADVTDKLHLLMSIVGVK